MPKSLHVLPTAVGRLLVLVAMFVSGTLPLHRAGAQASRGAAAGPSEFTILIYESDAQLALRTSPAHADAYWSAYDQFAGTLAKARVLRGGSALDEQTASTVRGTGSADRAVRGARLGGYFVIAVADLAAARTWAQQAPPRALAVEVRPHRPNPHMLNAPTGSQR